MADIGQMLDTLIALDGVEAAVVAGRDGLLIDGRQNRAHHSLEALGAVSASLAGNLDSMAADLETGAISQAMVEFERGMAIVQPVQDIAVLTVVLGSVTNLGRVRLALRKNQSMVQDALAGL